MRTLDDVYGPDHDDFPLEQELATLHACLLWDEAPASPDPRLPAWAYGPLAPQSSDRFEARAARR